jgi:hypothetical protein
MPLDINQHYALLFGPTTISIMQPTINENTSTVHSADLDPTPSNGQSLSQSQVALSDDMSEDIFHEQPFPLLSGPGTSFHDFDAQSNKDISIIENARISPIDSQAIRKHPRDRLSGPSNAAALPTTGDSRVPRPADDLSATAAHQLITEAIQKEPLPFRSKANGVKRKSAAVPHDPDRSLTKRVRVDRSLQGLPQSQVHCFSVSIPVEADHGCNKRKGKPLTHAQRLTREKGACLRCRVLKKPVTLSYDILFTVE